MADRSINRYRVLCQTESNYVYTWSQTNPTVCPNNNAHTIDLASLTVVDTVSENNMTITGAGKNGVYNKAGVTYDNKLNVDIPYSAFGHMKSTHEYPQVVIDFRYGLSTRYVTNTLLNAGTATSSNSMAYISSGAAANSSATINSNRYLRYVPGQGGNIMFTGIFSNGTAGNVQILGGGTTTNGFFFGYNGTAFGILTRNNSVDTWIPQSAWNIDKMDGTGPSSQVLNPQRGNVYRVSFQWLGFGAQTFMIEESTTGAFFPVHRVAYANTQTLPSLADPCLPSFAQSRNITNTTNVTLQAACFAGMSEGTPATLGLSFSEDNTKTLSTLTLTNVMSLRSKTIVNNIEHHIVGTPVMITIGATGNQSGIVYVHLNPTVAGTPSWTDINMSDSAMQLDTNGTTITGGTQVAGIPFIVGTVQTIDLSKTGITMYPGNQMTFGARLLKAGSTDVTISVVWMEER